MRQWTEVHRGVTGRNKWGLKKQNINVLHNTVVYCYYSNSLCPWQQLLGNQLARQEKLYTGSVFLGKSRLTIAHTVNIPERRAREEEWDEERGDKGRGGGGVSKRPLGKYWSGEWILCPASGLCEAIGPSDTPFIMPSIDSISRLLWAPSANTHTQTCTLSHTTTPSAFLRCNWEWGPFLWSAYHSPGSQGAGSVYGNVGVSVRCGWQQGVYNQSRQW